jgi:hypothetical protein
LRSVIRLKGFIPHIVGASRIYDSGEEMILIFPLALAIAVAILWRRWVRGCASLHPGQVTVCYLER